MRRLLSLVLAFSVIAPLSTAVVTRADDTPAQRAAREIADARERANQAAQDFFDAESHGADLEVKQTALQADVDDLQRMVSELEAKVRAIAVNRYTSSASASLPLLTGFKSPGDQVQVDALIDVVNAVSADDFDRYHALSGELADKRQLLAAKQAEARQQQQHLDELRVAATNEVARLKEVEAQRLQDESVRKALEAELAERARKSTEDAKRKAATQPAVTTTTYVAGGGANADQGGPSVVVAERPAATPTTTAGAATTVPGSTTPNTVPPGQVGGPTGVVGAGQQAAGPVGGDFGGPGWLCPTGATPMAFSDTWGAPRENGRRHEGVDLIGPRGSPLYAVVDGVAVGKENQLGGTTISFLGADGNRYYYAHLDNYGTLGAVTKGTVIGYEGQTGDAQFSIAHLHFEIHPGGGPAVDPYPTVRAHCPADPAAIH